MLATYAAAVMSRSRDQLRFRTTTGWMQGLVQERLNMYLGTLNSAAAMFSVREQPTAEEFRAYIERLGLQSLFPGAQGVGYAHRTPPAERKALEHKIRREVWDDFMITSEGVREDYFPIIYLEPQHGQNQHAIGYDMFSEPIRHEAMSRARDAGRPAVSGKVLLAPEIDANKEPGFLLYVPVYRGEIIPDFVQERRERLLGFVYSPFRAQDMFAGIFSSNRETDVRMDVYDGSVEDSANLLHSAGPAASKLPSFTSELPLEFADHQWTLRFLTTPEFDDASYAALVPWVLGTGLVISFFFFGVTVALARAHRDVQAAQKELRTHAENLEATVAARTAALTEAVAELQHMSYSIVHDLRAPLRAIQGFGGILEEEAGSVLSDECRGYVQRMRTAANRMDLLIRDVLSYGTIIQHELPLETIDVVILLHGIIETYPALKPASADIDVSPSIPPAFANSAALTQCLANLLINAVKFVEPGQRPRVQVTCTREQGSVVICVADNGIGIPKELQDRIFGMFQRLDNSYEGTGMGLAIVRKAAERMGGAVWVESEPGNGSRFFLKLNAAPNDQPSSKPLPS
jgi:signal transduction histidine kinase